MWYSFVQVVCEEVVVGPGQVYSLNALQLPAGRTVKQLESEQLSFRVTELQSGTTYKVTTWTNIHILVKLALRTSEAAAGV